MLVSLVICLVVVGRRHSGGGVQHDDLPAPHRDAQGARRCNPAVAWMFKFALWLTTGLSTKEWVAVHRKHHAFTDEEGDPHSPKLEGFWHVQLGNVFYYVREAKKTDVVERYARDIKEGWWDRHVFKHGIARPGDRHRAAVPGASGSGGGCWPPAFTPSCTCSCCRRRSTACATTSATRTSTTRRPTSACSRW